MINGNAGEFIDRIYTCQDTVFIYNGIKYWFQGYMPSDNTVHMEVFQTEPPADGYVWVYDGCSISEGQAAFQKAPIFDGKTFWEVEKEIEWTDD
jgi:hypothetical protein